jgi:hypothetical protein
MVGVGVIVMVGVGSINFRYSSLPTCIYSSLPDKSGSIRTSEDGVSVIVGVGVFVGVLVIVGVIVDVNVGVGVFVGVLVIVGVNVGVGVRM